jgi:hypothetical protein
MRLITLLVTLEKSQIMNNKPPLEPTWSNRQKPKLCVYNNEIINNLDCIGTLFVSFPSLSRSNMT